MSKQDADKQGKALEYTSADNIHRMHIKRCNSLGQLTEPVAAPWASVISRLGV